MMENYPIPPIYLAQLDDRSYDGLDGKQRTETLRGFLDNEWMLENDCIVVDKYGDEHDFSCYYFSDLPEWAQDAIKEYPLTITYFQDLTEEQYQEMFYRLNNGKALSAVEQTRARTKSLPQFQQMAKHDIIDIAINEKGKANFNHENLVMQAWALNFAFPNDDKLSFDTKVWRPFIEEAEVDEVQMGIMENLFNIALNMYNACDQKRQG